MRRVGRTVGGVLVFALIFFGSGEIILRVYFASGETFNAGGPIAARFREDLAFNRFDGPSRGPEPAARRSPGQIRILVQGDSITWGQGVREEADLYTSRLLERLRRDHLDVEMAALAYPGREIDGHIAQLERWGKELDPDIIIYQWFVNDVELDKSGRPHSRFRLWRHIPFQRILRSHSYLWFFLDYTLDELLPTWAPTYADYLSETFRPGTPGWHVFAEAFHEWASLAKELTPNVIVALYPLASADDDKPVVAIYEAVERLCSQEGLDFIDLWDPLLQLKRDHELYASRYDMHPGEAGHAQIAEALYEKLTRAGGALASARPKKP